MEIIQKKIDRPSPLSLSRTAESIDGLDIPDTMVEDLVLRRLFTTGTSSLKTLSQALKLPYPAVRTIFERLRKEHYFEVKGMQGQDYVFTLSAKGREYARKSYDMCRYNGPAPVSLDTYREVVTSQTGKVDVDRSTLTTLFSDLVLTGRLLDQLGPALISQNSIFLYGPTGNGKTSIARRLTRIYNDLVAIKYEDTYDNQIIVVYDPVFHERVETDVRRLDDRWVLCRRPCVIAGGELSADMLELKIDLNTGVYAAPLQMKANNGMLVIDDFGRQILSPEYLLNRWIVPLDRKVDYLSLTYGVKFEIPFQMAVVFSTNLDPSKLADEAFLRRIQNKIYIEPVDPEVFDQIFHRLIKSKGYPCEPDTTFFLRSLCTQFAGHALRACYPADILTIIESISRYEQTRVEISNENLERAARIYFTNTFSVDEKAA